MEYTLQLYCIGWVWVGLACGANDVRTPEHTPAWGTAPQLASLRTWGTAGSDFARAIAPFPTGGVVIAGYSDGDLPSAASMGEWDGFVTRFDEQGVPIWAEMWGSPGADFAQAVAVDPHGNVLVGGYTTGALTEAPSEGGHDAFVAKWSSAGTMLWLRQWGSPDDDDVYAIAVDLDGSPTLVGYTQGAVGDTPNQGRVDAFATKFSSAGELLWTSQWGTSDTDYAQAASLDGTGNLLVTGYTAGVVPGQVSRGGEDVFITKLSSQGEVVWSRQVGSPTTDYGLSVTTDELADVYVAGYTYGEFAGTTANGGEDAFLVKFDARGDLLWTRQWGTPNNDNARAVVVTSPGGIAVVGDTQGDLDGNLNAGHRDAFVSGFLFSGERLWTRLSGGPSNEFALGVTPEASGALVSVGYSDTGGSGAQRDAWVSVWGATAQTSQYEP